MKKVALIVLLFVLLETGVAASDCKQEDVDKLQSCYKDVYGKDLSAYPSGPNLLTEPIFSDDSTKEFWQPFCDKKQKLNDCIGADIIKTCYNMDDIKKIPYGNATYTDALAKYVIASFIQVDFVCDKFFKLSDADYTCFIDNEHILHNECYNGTGVSTCKELNAVDKCIVDGFYKRCGKAVGCFARKQNVFDECYFAMGCQVCKSISSTNNLIDGLCDDNEHVEEKIVDKNPKFFNRN